MKNSIESLKLQQRALAAFLQSDSGIITIDTITDDQHLKTAFADGGCSRGPAFRKVTSAVAKRVGSARSKRKTRKGSQITVWQLEEPILALEMLIDVKRRLMVLDPSDEPPKPRYRQKRLGGGFDDE